ncbi:hypothetical protein PanWU01x14_184500, partial [Parasponia andersonii]
SKYGESGQVLIVSESSSLLGSMFACGGGKARHFRQEHFSSILCEDDATMSNFGEL